VLCKVGSVLQSSQFIYSNLESFTHNNTNYKSIQKGVLAITEVKTAAHIMQYKIINSYQKW